MSDYHRTERKIIGFPAEDLIACLPDIESL